MPRKLKIALIAPPWLSLYPGCFYGIEVVVQNLAAGLAAHGHHVELFSVGGSRTSVAKKHWYHQEDQYQHIHRPYYEVAPVLISHLLYSLNIIREAGDFDIIHDHNSYIGPPVFAYATDLPPVLHTLHEPFTDEHKLALGVPDNRLMFDQFKHIKNLYFNAISYKQKSLAPDGLQPRIKGVIHHGVNPDDYLYSQEKDDYFTIVGSTSPDKGQAVAAKAAFELGARLKIAGTIGGNISTSEELREAYDNKQFDNDRFFQYFKNEISPFTRDGQIEYIGSVAGETKKKLFSKAKAFVFPVNWEEPFGMVVLDALASGTPVIAYNRGAMPEIIEHGVNGFIAKNFEELKMYMKRAEEISPAACRESVLRKFSVEVETRQYERLYSDIIKRYWKMRARNIVRSNLGRLSYTHAQGRPAFPKLLPNSHHSGHYIHRRLSSSQ